MYNAVVTKTYQLNKQNKNQSTLTKNEGIMPSTFNRAKQMSN